MDTAGGQPDPGPAEKLLTPAVASARIHSVDGDGGGGPEEPDTERGKPEGLAGLRWEQPQPMIVSGFRGGWRAWLTGSESARRAARCLAVADTAGIAVAVTLIAASLVRGGPAGGTGVLWVPGILLLAAGQVWAILVITARQPPGTGRRFRIETGQARSISRDLRAYFGPLDRRVTRTVAALCVIGLVSFITAIFSTRHGGPAGPGGGCAYRVASHGVYTCVSKSAYDLAGAGEQRIAAGIFLFFFAVHLYAALASGQAGQQVTRKST